MILSDNNDFFFHRLSYKLTLQPDSQRLIHNRSRVCRIKISFYVRLIYFCPKCEENVMSAF